jgi:hypothetical protein
MPAIVRCNLIMALLLVLCQTMNAQTDLQDVLYLKNGSIIRGMITQFIPDSTVKIQTADGSLFVFRSAEVEKVLKEENPAAAHKKLDSISQKKNKTVAAGFFAGVGIPGSDFGDVAKTGFTIGLQVYSKNTAGFLASISYASNPTSVNENWGSLLILAGLKLSLKKTETSDFYFAPVIGLYMQRFTSNTSNAFAYGGMMGVQASEHFGIGVQIITAKPEYTFWVPSYTGGYYGYYTYQQVTVDLSTTLAQIYLLVTF